MSHGGGQPRGGGEKKGPTLPKYSRASMLAKRGATYCGSGGKSVSWGSVPAQSVSGLSSASAEDPHAPASVESVFGKSVPAENDYEESMGVVSASEVNISGSSLSGLSVSSLSAEDRQERCDDNQVPVQSVSVVSVSSLSAEDMQERGDDNQVPVQSVSVVSFSGVTISGCSVSGLSLASAEDPHAPAFGEMVSGKTNPAENDSEESVGEVSASEVNISGSSYSGLSVSSLSAEDRQDHQVEQAPLQRVPAQSVPAHSVSVVSVSSVSAEDRQERDEEDQVFEFSNNEYQDQAKNPGTPRTQPMTGNREESTPNKVTWVSPHVKMTPVKYNTPSKATAKRNILHNIVSLIKEAQPDIDLASMSQSTDNQVHEPVGSLQISPIR